MELLGVDQYVDEHEHCCNMTPKSEMIKKRVGGFSKSHEHQSKHGGDGSPGMFLSVNRLISSNLKAKKILKWKPKYSGKKGFILGLKNTIDWFKKYENFDYYNHEIYNL